MKVTDVKVRIRPGAGAVKATASITLDDCFAVHGLRVIEGKSGFHVAMPSERKRVPCPKCSRRNEVGSRYCHFCGSALPEAKGGPEHRDVAHPINQQTRDAIESAVIQAYRTALASAESVERRGEAEEGGRERTEGGKRSVFGGLLGLFRTGEDT